MTKCIEKFRDEYSFLSNFYEVPININGYIFNNAESAFQSFKDMKEQKEFVGLNAKQAKSLGRKVQLREDWEAVKDNIMYQVVLAKFAQNKNLRDMLIATGDAKLIEGNTWNDRYWGVCRGKGENKLGLILEHVRSELNELDVK